MSKAYFPMTSDFFIKLNAVGDAGIIFVDSRQETIRQLVDYWVFQALDCWGKILSRGCF